MRSEIFTLWRRQSKLHGVLRSLAEDGRWRWPRPGYLFPSDTPATHSDSPTIHQHQERRKKKKSQQKKKNKGKYHFGDDDDDEGCSPAADKGPEEECEEKKTGDEDEIHLDMCHSAQAFSVTVQTLSAEAHEDQVFRDDVQDDDQLHSCGDRE